MIFSKKSIQQILAGKKTQTRRLVKDKENLVGVKDGFLGVYTKSGKTKWFVGKTYAVCPGRGKRQYEVVNGASRKPLWIEVTWLKMENLLDISQKDVVKEGFDSRTEFLEAFWDINEKSIPRNTRRAMDVSCTFNVWNPKVFVISFRVS